MAKLHHKLKYLNDYLSADFKAAYRTDHNPQNYVQLAVKTLGVSLNSRAKAKRMYPLMSKVGSFYVNSNHQYSLKVAILVSKHIILSKNDYLTLKNVLDQNNLIRDNRRAQSTAQITKPSLLSMIF